MSNDDQYGGAGGSGYGEVGGTGQTRTRLPESASDPYGTPPRRTPAPRAAWSRWSAWWSS